VWEAECRLIKELREKQEDCGMDVRNCKQCGRLFNYIGGQYRNLCPACTRALEDKFMEVKQYIEDNKQAQMNEISEACDVSVRQLEQWVREERLRFSEDSPIGIACEMCGATIKSGRFCEACKSSLANQLDNAYAKPIAAHSDKKAARDSARMRFLDN
jgi:flagellar operon protein (TIGR03826 family)